MSGNQFNNRKNFIKRSILINMDFRFGNSEVLSHSLDLTKMTVLTSSLPILTVEIFFISLFVFFSYNSIFVFCQYISGAIFVLV